MNLFEYRIGDVMKLARRPVEVAAEKAYEEIGLRSFGNGVFHKPAVVGEELGSKKVFYIEPGDLLFSNVFAWEGAVALASEQERGKIGSHRFLTYRVDADKADARYLMHYFYGGPGVQAIREASPGSAGRNRTLGIKRFENQIVRLPGLEEQRRVAEKLAHAATQMNKVKKLQENAELLRTKTLASLIPRDLDPSPLSDALLRIKRPVALEPETPYRLLGVRWYAKGPFVREVKYGKEISSATAYRVEEGDFIYNRLFGWKGSFGCVTSDLAGAHVSNEFPTFRVNSERATLEYVMLLFRVPSLWESALSRSSGSTPGSRNRLKEEHLLSMEVPLPSLEQQERLIDQARAIISTSRLSQNIPESIESVRQSLLDAAFSGRL